MTEIEVKESAAPAQVQSAIRDLLKVIGSVLATKGILQEGMFELAAGAVLVLAPVVWSQIVVRLKHFKMKVLADTSPIGRVVK